MGHHRRIEPRQVERLKEMGAWLAQYGDGVYGTRGGPYKPGKWGASTCKADKIYLFLMQTDGFTFKLPALSAKVHAMKLLAGGQGSFAQNDENLTLTIPEKHQRKIATVVELTVQGKAFDIEPIDVN